MTCRECRHWEQCVLPDGTTKYYGTENACGDVHRRCKWFISKTEVAQQKWIPVTERLPEKKENALLYFNSGNMAVGYWYSKDENMTFWEVWTDNGWYSDADYEPTHWMPLPQSPKVALEDVVDLDKQTNDNNAAMRKVMDFMTEGLE